jgi:hypothetical protein
VLLFGCELDKLFWRDGDGQGVVGILFGGGLVVVERVEAEERGGRYIVEFGVVVPKFVVHKNGHLVGVAVGVHDKVKGGQDTFYELQDVVLV